MNTNRNNWNTQERKQLLELLGSGGTTTEASRKLSRSHSAITKKVNELLKDGVLTRTGFGRHTKYHLVSKIEAEKRKATKKPELKIKSSKTIINYYPEGLVTIDGKLYKELETIK